MKLLIPEKVSFKGPDPPPEDWRVNEVDPASNQAEAVQPGKAPAGKKKEDLAVPVEVLKSPEVEAAEKQVRRFLRSFMSNLLALQVDVNEYRTYS